MLTFNFQFLAFDFWMQLGWSLVLGVRWKTVTSTFDLFGCTKEPFGIPDTASRWWERTQRGIVVPRSAAQGLQPRQGLLLMESCLADVARVLFALLNCKELVLGLRGKNVAERCKQMLRFALWNIMRMLSRLDWFLISSLGRVGPGKCLNFLHYGFAI